MTFTSAATTNDSKTMRTFYEVNEGSGLFGLRHP